ncbi:MAG: hypothetical protein VX777_02030 [Chlamydiota bacterium]|nr:hypothetical protein [Chlamydiota bacterium]
MTTHTGEYTYNLVNEGRAVWELPMPLNDETSELTLQLPRYVSYKPKSSKINPLIFALSLNKTPNIKKLNITKLNIAESSLLEPVMNLFKEHYPKNLVSITVNTPVEGFGEWNREIERQQRYRELMESLAHSQLTGLKINDDVLYPSPLDYDVFSDFFLKSPNLQTIEISLKERVIDLTIPFDLCRNLEKITLRHCHGITEETFNLLKTCKKLHSLQVEDFWETNHLINFLIKPHGLNLKVLDFGNSTALSSDYELFMIIKQLPNLEVFGQTRFFSNHNRITDEGLALLAQSCPKLTSFSFCFENITDNGFAVFTKKASNLQRLSTSNVSHLGEASLLQLAKNCPQLKSLELTGWKEISESALLALAKGCPQLEHLEISYCHNVSIESIEKFVQTASRLKSILIYPDSDFKKEEIKHLKQSYQHLNWNPDYRTGNSIKIDPPQEIINQETPIFSQKLLDKFLLESVRHKRIEDIVEFIKLGANPNMVSTVNSTHFTPSYNENPLALAAQKGNFEIVQCLHESGANFNEVEKILGGLSQPKHLEVLEYLLANECNPNIRGEYDMTPIQVMAAMKRTGTKYAIGNEFSTVSLDCVKKLVSYNADTSVLHQEKYSLADIARKSDNKEVYKYFTEELMIPEKQAQRPIRELGAKELIVQACDSLRNINSDNSLDTLFQATWALLSRDLGKQPIPSTDRLPSGAKNPVESILSKPICDAIEKLLPNIKEQIIGFTFTPELEPKRGIYYLKSEADKKISGASYRKCMCIIDDCMAELLKSKQTAVIEKTENYDPMKEIIICTPNHEYFLIKNIHGFLKGTSTAERIV